MTQLAATKVEGNGFQPVRAQCVRVQDFQDGAEADGLGGSVSIAIAPDISTIAPTEYTVRRRSARNILPPRRHLFPVFDISVVLG